MARLVVDFEDEVLAKILERNLGAEAGAEIPHLVRPLLERGVVSHSAFESDRFIFGLAGRLARSRRVAALAEFDDLGAPLERAHLRQSRDIGAVRQAQAELVGLVRIAPVGVDAERWCHNRSPLGLRPRCGFAGWK